jgi:hypothetical protein
MGIGYFAQAYVGHDSWSRLLLCSGPPFFKKKSPLRLWCSPHLFQAPRRTAPLVDPVVARSNSWALSLPRSLPAWNACSGISPLCPALLALFLLARHPTPPLAVLCTRGASPSSVASPSTTLVEEGEAGEACACIWACASIHLALSAGSGGLCHHNSPPSRSWPRDNAVFFKSFQAFSDVLKAYVSNVSVISGVCFKCFIQMLQK